MFKREKERKLLERVSTKNNKFEKFSGYISKTIYPLLENSKFCIAQVAPPTKNLQVAQVVALDRRIVEIMLKTSVRR